MKLLIINKRFIIAGIIILMLAIITFTTLRIYNKSEATFNSDPYYQGNIETKTIAFACNIDWGNEYIPKMLEIFKENNIKITYFPTGKWAEKNGVVLKDIYNQT